MNRYQYNKITRERTTDNNLRIDFGGFLPSDDELYEKGQVHLDIIQPTYDIYTQTVRDGGTELIDGKNAKVIQIIEDLPREVVYNNLYKVVDEYISRMCDEVARRKGYDNRITCVLRSLYDNPQKNEAIAFRDWMESCYQISFSMLEQYRDGTYEIDMSELEELEILNQNKQNKKFGLEIILSNLPSPPEFFNIPSNDNSMLR